MSQELVNSVNKLTDETSALLQEYVKGNTVLQNSASEAASSATAAKVSEGITIDKANVATQKAAEAKQFRDETAAVATGGTATLDPTPGKIPLANAEAKIHAGWLPVNVSALSEAIVEAIRDVNKEQYAASGFIHDGKAYVPSNVTIAINEGMWTYAIPQALLTNSFAMGNMAGSQVGTSATPHPVMNVAGFEVHLRGINTDNTALCNKIILPESPNGTVVSDSSGNCRGTGKPTLDLSKEVDPKYGDVASSVNEAVARAFEGIVRDGDLRNGAGAWIGTGSVVNNEIVLGDAQYLWQYTGGYYDISSSKDYVVEVVAADIVGTAEIIIYADTNKAASRRLLNGINVFTLTEFTQNFGSTTDYVRLATSSGSTAKILSVSLREVTEEVVTDRVDMAGLEFSKEKAREYLYPYGMIQSKATTVDGIATTEDTTRPITYFAVFDGDTTSRGRGWKLADLTFVQLATIMSNPEHNSWYNEAGELMQFRCRQRSFAGLGNGDWRVINPKGDILSFGTENLTRVAAQGRLDTPASPSGGGNFFAGYTFTAHNAKPEVGMFTVSSNSGDYQAPDGECYFYVLATVPRLNQGAYHQSLNPMGTAFIAHETSPTTNAYWWYSPEMPAGLISSTADCFSKKSPRAGFTGKIGDTSKARPDGRFYDAIYASGQGGVIDWRLPARDMSGKEEAAKVFQKVVNGTYRGLEKLVKTRFRSMNKFYITGTNAQNASVSLTQGGSAVADLFGAGMPTGMSIQVYQPSSGKMGYGNISNANGHIRITEIPGNLGTSNHSSSFVQSFGTTDPVYIYEVAETNISVSGDFTTLDVVGDPEKIMATEALAYGWMGRWIPVISVPSVRMPLTRKALTSKTLPIQWTTNLGASWATGAQGCDNITNTLDPWSSSNVAVVTYTAFAKQTKSSTNKAVLNGLEGVGDVIALNDGRNIAGSLLVEGLIGKVPTCNAAGKRYSTLYTQSIQMWVYSGQLQSTTGYEPTHTPIDLVMPNNDSPSVKALWHQASNNQQATLNFLWNELVFDTNWRTPDKVWSGGSVSVAVGETFRAESSSAYAVAGLLMRCVKALTANATVLGAMHVSVGGDVISLSDGQTYFKVVNNGWSDDSIIRIIDGVGTFNNENGDTCLYGTDELAMPYGYTKNQAGAGKQVVGVDL
ncbi:hypothetical protein AB4S96_000874 [Vibrio vulnificus]|nr:hypothetical protein [Vibrio vulnificus]MCU8217765.1 hypothetical protein [Vibrio vulnificus]